MSREWSPPMQPRELLRAFQITPRQAHRMSAASLIRALPAGLLQVQARRCDEVPGLIAAADAACRLLAEANEEFPDESFQVWLTLVAAVPREQPDSWERVPD